MSLRDVCYDSHNEFYIQRTERVCVCAKSAEGNETAHMYTDGDEKSWRKVMCGWPSSEQVPLNLRLNLFHLCDGGEQQLTFEF